jgi:hypothetical protein
MKIFRRELAVRRTRVKLASFATREAQLWWVSGKRGVTIAGAEREKGRSVGSEAPCD